MRRGFLILLLLFTAAARAQGPIDFFANVDSLKKAEANALEDTGTVFLYTNLATAYRYVNQDTAILYATKGLALAKKLNFVRGEAYLLMTMGEALAFQGNLAKGLELKLDALRKAEPLKDTFLLAMCYNFLGSNYTYSQDFETALFYYNKVKPYIRFAQILNKYLLGQIGTCHLRLNNLDSAYHYTKQAYDLDIKEATHWVIVYQNMGELEAKKGNYNKALQYYRQESTVINTPSLGMATTFQKMGQQDSAIYYARQALVYGDPSFMSKLSVTSVLAELYKSSGQIDSAYKYQQMLLAVKDSVFSQEKVKQVKNLETAEQLRLLELEHERKEAQQQSKSKIRLNALAGITFTLVIIAFILYRSYRNKVKANNEINKAYRKLEAAQAQLIQSEKMASLGELTAGIAHEIQNPLNFVNNFSEINKELLEDVQEEAAAGNTAEVLNLVSNIRDNEEKINFHGRRADAIVKGMLQHSRKNTGQKEPTDINALMDEYLRLSYHGMRAKDKTFNATIKTKFDENIGNVTLVPQEIGRVLLNLFNNAFYAVHERLKKLGAGYEPTVSVSTKKLNDKIEIRVDDNGMGISKSLVDKIFQPFYTTKPAGQGTGLGLSLSYDIVKAHGGEIQVTSEEGRYTEFIITLPIST